MKLLYCHIENFGHLRNLDLTLEEGVNIICRENGWGKSTFSAFLRAMFYGLPGSRRKKTQENEREKYRPWQGGTYGGHLAFAVRGKKFEITRVFGRKESEDQFEIRELGSNLLCDEYSSKTGEELFRLDRESFSRTLFIGQQDCETAATDNINALIADLETRAGDMGDCETALRLLAEAAGRLTPDRPSGILYRRAEQIQSLEREAAAGREVCEKLEQCSEEKQRAQEKEKNLEEELCSLRKKIELTREAEKEKRRRAGSLEIASQREYVRQRLRAVRDHRQREMDKALAFFPGRVPSRAEIDEYLKKCREAERLESKIQAGILDEEEQNRLTLLENEFLEEEAVPGGRYIEGRYIKYEDGCPKGRPGNSAQDKRQKGQPRNSSRNKCRKGPHENSSQERRRRELSGQIVFLPAVLFIAAGLVIMTAGIIGAVFTGKAAFTFAAAAGAVLCGAGAAGLYLRRHESFPAGTKDGERSGQSMREIRRREYEYLKKKEQDLEDMYSEWTRIRRPVHIFLKELGFSSREDIHAQLEEIRDAADDWEDAVGLLREAEQELRSFEEETKKLGLCTFEKEMTGPEGNSFKEEPEGPGKNMYGEEPPGSEPRSFGEEPSGSEPRSFDENADTPESERLWERMEKVQSALQQSRETNAALSEQLDELRADCEEWEQSVRLLGELKIQQTADETRRRQILAAEAALRKARNALTSRFTDPITASFRKNWEMITSCSAAGIRVNAGSEVTADEQGKQRESALLSTGYRDLAGICLRIALADAMYPKGYRDPPPLIMDDPFTNLDDDKIEGAMRFLRETGRRYQIIYLTCSSSRC